MELGEDGFARLFVEVVREFGRSIARREAAQQAVESVAERVGPHARFRRTRHSDPYAHVRLRRWMTVSRSPSTMPAKKCGWAILRRTSHVSDGWPECRGETFRRGRWRLVNGIGRRRRPTQDSETNACLRVKVRTGLSEKHARSQRSRDV